MLPFQTDEGRCAVDVLDPAFFTHEVLDLVPLMHARIEKEQID
jgi:hypothetical protein